ncbi:hypothetical protein PRIPAC_94164, partial [Pristionchus pacificus]|uniref:Uncharacterized protein n=1 Tax=Pristionchus pacificus TaxID=54126 RepID=A0A2A6CI53_PRIPA
MIHSAHAVTEVKQSKVRVLLFPSLLDTLLLIVRSISIYSTAPALTVASSNSYLTLPEPDLTSRKDVTIWGNKISVAEDFKPNDSSVKAKFIEESATQDEEKLAKIKATLRNLRQLFLACSYVEYLNMRFFTTSNLMDITKTFHQVPVKEVVFMFVLLDEEKRYLCDLISSNNFSSSIGKFLLNISKQLLMLELHQCSADIDVHGYPSAEDHPLYGIPSHFWHAISRQMLGSGLHRFKFSDGKDCL